MDAFTAKHLEAWFDRVLTSDDNRDAVRAAMVEAYSDDPEYWSNAGWLPLFDSVNGLELAQNYIR
jgi:hypothetical protein